jgi:hypothetical protein
MNNADETLFRHPDLAPTGAAMRAEWRDEEEEWMRAAAQHWAHGRSLHDVARDFMHRGDTIEAVAAGRSFTGRVDFVGDDFVELRTPTRRVEVRTVFADGRGDALAPLVLRVVEKARAGGHRGVPGASTMRARLLEREAGARPAVLGSMLLADEVRGHVGVGRDHVTVRSDGPDTVVPLAWVSWVTSARG